VGKRFIEPYLSIIAFTYWAHFFFYTYDKFKEKYPKKFALIFFLGVVIFCFLMLFGLTYIVNIATVLWN